MADFTREEVIAKVAHMESLRKAYLFDADLSEADLSGVGYNDGTK